MREIIYIQAGALPNYTGTHYWNTQEAYFVYDGGDVSLADFNISFKEGRDNHPTLRPRLLAFDQKSNFGTLGKYSRQEETPAWPTTWYGSVSLQEQERLPQSEYHSLLDAEGVDERAEPSPRKIRYWSDFSRVFFDPKSIQAVPDMLESVQGDWSASCASFLRYDGSVELMDGSLRLLVEDCDNFQGLQMIHDTSFFGGFSGSLLEAFCEEYPKATIVAFACLSSVSALDANIGDSSQVKQVLNDTLSLRSITAFCDLAVPILSPTLWERECWFPGYSIDNESLYQSSAILSTYIESATLPLRLKHGSDDLQTMVAHLNRRKSSPLATLAGTLCPQGLSTENLRDIPRLSFHTNERAVFARRDVSRGLSQNEVGTYNTWSKAHELREPFFVRHHLPSYPIPTSFPAIFPEARPGALKVISSLSASSSMGGHISGYARFLDSAARRRDGVLLAMGLENDEVREFVGALWNIADEYGGHESCGDLSEGMGDDEV